MVSDFSSSDIKYNTISSRGGHGRAGCIHLHEVIYMPECPASGMDKMPMPEQADMGIRGPIR
jgi:hypothetical protein